MAKGFIEQFVAARKRSVPIIGVTTPDPAAAMDGIAKALKSADPILRWDVVSGLVAGNAQGRDAMQRAKNPVTDKPEPINGSECQNPVDALTAILRMPAKSVVFMVNAHLFLKQEPVLQAVWNLRDQFKTEQRTLVLLGPAMPLPPELEHDVIVIDEPLPDRTALLAIIREQWQQATDSIKGFPALTSDVEDRAADALTGLAAFTSEQIMAMSLTKTGVDLDLLWERKRQAIEQTPGMTVWRGGESLDDVAGYDNAKLSVRRLKGSKREPRVVVFIDEIEKMIGGAERDSSGVSQDQLGQILSYMQDHNVEGMIFIGPPGAGKTAIAKAAGTTLGVPTIALDLGGMKGSLVGESEARVRAALKVITAVGSDQAIFIATCNSIGNLPPELRRRFTRGTFFFDLPSKDERRAIWSLYARKYELDITALPDDEGWTGAEIRQCARMAWDMGLTLREAAEYVVPVATSAHEAIDRLREQASGRFISASHPGVYKQPEKPLPAESQARGKRDYSLA